MPVTFTSAKLVPRPNTVLRALTVAAPDETETGAFDEDDEDEDAALVLAFVDDLRVLDDEDEAPVVLAIVVLLLVMDEEPVLLIDEPTALGAL